MNDRNGREKAEQGCNKIRSNVCNAAESYGTCLFAGRFLGIRDLRSGRLFYSGHYVLFSGGGISIYPLKKEVRAAAPALCSDLTGTVSGGPWHTSAEYAVHLSLLILVCLEYIQDSAERSVCVCLLAAATCICDWGGLAAAFTVLFAQAYGSRRKLLYAYGVDYLLFSLVSAAEYAKKLSWALAVPRGLLEGVGILVSGVVIIFFYSGKRTGTGGRFSKWFFYVFYPMHLFALWVINISYF